MRMLRLLRDIREDLTPLLHEKQSNMLVDGMLSPEEFVAAGDRLCEASPIWGWAQGDVDKRKGYLPPNKQFLVVRGLASNGSVHGDGEWRVEMDEWCDAALGTGDQQEHDMVFIDYTYTPEKSSASSAAGAGVGAGARDVRTAHKTQDADNRVDSHVVVGADVLDGPIPPNGNGPSTASGTSATGQQQQQQQTLHAARLYDLSVSYDRYYRVPRFWMRGYDAVTGLPLEPREVLTDFIKDQGTRAYAHRAVTPARTPALTHRSPHHSTVG